MGVLTTDLVTIGLTEQVLARQAEHCRGGAVYLSQHGSISGHTGLVLAPLGPLSDVVTAGAAAVLRLGGELCDTTAHSARATLESYLATDQAEARKLLGLGRGLGTAASPAAPYVPLGPAQSSAPPDHGQADSYFWQKGASTGESLADILLNGADVARDVTRWGQGGGGVVEAVDAGSYLVPPTASENVIQDLRWNAGVILGSVDWVFEQLCGYSILEELIFKPFGGDSSEIKKAGQAWAHTGEALSAVAANHARLVPTTVAGWQGEAADAFRAAMALISEGFARLAGLCDTMTTALNAVALAVTGVCAGIGFALRTIAEMLIEIAAELSVPGIGWGMLLATAYWKVEKIFMGVRLIYSLTESLLDVIASFAEAQASSVADLGRFEDIAEGVFRRAAQAVA